MLAEFSISPVGAGASVGKWVARCLDIVDRSGLPYRLGSMGTTVEGELDEVLDLLQARLDLGLVSAGPGRGLLRWSGEPSLAALQDLRHVAAEREMPLTLERGPWNLRRAFGHHGAYREAVGGFAPDPTFTVALEAEGS